MEQFDRIFGIIATAVLTLIPVVTLIVQSTPTPKDDDVWGKIALVLGRLFGAKTFADASGKSNISIPVLQSAKPKSEK